MKISSISSKKAGGGLKEKVSQLLKKKKKSSGTELNSDSDPNKKKSRKKTIIIIAVIAVAVIAVIFAVKLIGSSKSSAASDVTYTTAAVVKRDISVTLSGSGTLEPADSYEVTSLVSGEILSDGFEEGDTVEEGDVLYQIDTSDAETSIKSAELNVEKSQLNYDNVLETLDNLNVKAPVAGTVTELNVEVGDTVQSGSQIGTVRDSSTMTLVVPFNSSDVDSFYVGETATVTLDSTFESLSGNISKISATEQVLTGNMLVKNVTIEVSNPGGITESTEATASVDGIACNSSSAFTYKSSQTITAKASGTVSSIVADEGDIVNKNATVVTLSSDNISENVKSAELSLEDAENSLENKQEALDDYTITSPISGTVIDKAYKAGDKLGSSSGSSNATLCTIYDLSYLTMDLSVDELDISEVEVGQNVAITADAVEDKTYSGTVTKVSVSGTTSNGVTAYPVTVRIDDTEGLLPGMNVDYEIVVESATGAVSVPVDAVVRNNMVLVKTDNSGSSDDEEGKTLSVGKDGLPDGFEYKEVTLGVNDDDYIEIKSGLEEGDIIAVKTVNTDDGEANQTGDFGFSGGGTSGDMNGGGQMPQGGGPGGGSGGGPMGG